MHHTCVAGLLIRLFQPSNHQACSVIFSHVDPDVLYAASSRETVRLNVADGSITELRGHSGGHFCDATAMVLANDGSALFVGYLSERCVVAYDVATLQLMWKADFESDVFSVLYHDELVFVTFKKGPVTVLNAADGSVVRTLGDADGRAWGISVFAGLRLATVDCRRASCIEEPGSAHTAVHKCTVSTCHHQSTLSHLAQTSPPRVSSSATSTAV